MPGAIPPPVTEVDPRRDPIGLVAQWVADGRGTRRATLRTRLWWDGTDHHLELEDVPTDATFDGRGATAEAAAMNALHAMTQHITAR
jgi:hypothetical protein